MLHLGQFSSVQPGLFRSLADRQTACHAPSALPATVGRLLLLTHCNTHRVRTQAFTWCPFACSLSVPPPRLLLGVPCEAAYCSIRFITAPPSAVGYLHFSGQSWPIWPPFAASAVLRAPGLTTSGNSIASRQGRHLRAPLPRRSLSILAPHCSPRLVPLSPYLVFSFLFFSYITYIFIRR